MEVSEEDVSEDVFRRFAIFEPVSVTRCAGVVVGVVGLDEGVSVVVLLPIGARTNLKPREL